MERIRKNSKLIIFILIIVVIVIFNHIFGWSDYLSDSGNLRFLSDMISDHFLTAALIYIVLTIVACVVLALPGVTFAIIAGIVFGPWWGTLLCLIATTLGAIIAFIVGRFFLKDSIKPLIAKNRLLKKILFDDAGRSDIVLLAITRLVPLFPYNIQNFAYGITDISLAHYSLYTFIFMIPGVALYTIGTAGFTSSGNRALYFGIAGILLVMVLLLGWYIKKKYLASDLQEPAVDISEYIRNSEYRTAVGLPDTVKEKYQLLAQGEYNVNFLFERPSDKKMLVLRVNCGSQMHLDHQIEYEANALKQIVSSGRTPEVHYVDDSRKYIDHGVLVMDFLPGEYPDYKNASEMSAAIQCLADIHAVRIDESRVVHGNPESVSSDTTGLIAPETSFRAILEECESMFSVYENSELGEDDIKKQIRRLLTRGHEIVDELEASDIPIPYRCCINTELNNTNFLVEHTKDAVNAYLVDWEKPLYGDPAQDLGHMLAPTTTFWKTDVIYDQERVEELIDEYIRAAGDRFDTTGIRERTHQFINITCLRGITWCAMAWIQYHDPDKTIVNESTARKLDQYISKKFLDDIEERIS